MKIFKKRVISFLLLSCFSLFFSCENFLDSSDAKKQLDEKIEYQKSAQFNVTVAPEKAEHGILLSESSKSGCRVTDEFEVEFNLASSYIFIGWKAVKKSAPSVSLDEFVSFERKSALKTNVKIIKANQDILNGDLLIRPACVETVGLTSETHPNREDGLVVARDFSPVLTFNCPISKDQDLSKIQVTVSNENGTESEDALEKGYFSTPVLDSNNQNQIKIMANIQNRIEVLLSSTKKITITIPSEITYETNSGTVPIGKEISYSYTINYTTSSKTNVNFGIKSGDYNPNDVGTLRIDGQSGSNISKVYSIGESTYVEFKVDSAFKFEGWEVSDTAAFIIDYPREDFTNKALYCDGPEGWENYFDKKTNIAYAIVTCINAADNATISAKVSKYPTNEIKISSTKGKISPNTKESFKVDYPIPLTFAADSDYCFTHWQARIGNKIDDGTYVVFDDAKNPETNAILKAIPENNALIVIEPICENRPTTLFYTPTYSAAGAYRDARIQIMFDHDMNSDSIYYTKEEINEIIEEYGIDESAFSEFEVDDGDEDDSTHSGIYYGYKNGDEIVYKNIQVKNHANNSNMLSYFGEPYFETADMLVIPSKKGNESPASLSQIVVEISKNVFYSIKISDDTVNIPMANSLKWSYRCNDKVDSDVPNLVIKSLTTNAKAKTVTETATPSTFNLTFANCKDYYSSDRKLYVSAEVKDEGSGPTEKLYYVLTNVLDSDYKIPSKTILYLTHPYVPLNVVTTTANISDYEIDLSNYADGVYKIHFYTKDANGNTAYSYSTSNKYYYLTLDKTGPRILDTELPSVNTSASNQLTALWDMPSVADFEKVEIFYKKKGDSSSTKLTPTTTAGTNSQVISSLTNATTYEITYRYYDVFGNTTDKIVTKNTIPNVVTNFTATISDRLLTCNWTAPAVQAQEKGYAGIRVYYNTIAFEDKKSAIAFADFSPTSKSLTLNSAYSGKKIYLRYYTLDGEYNISAVDTGTQKTVIVKPYQVPSAPTYTREDYSKNITLKWNKPSYGDVTGYRIVYGTTPTATTYSIDTTNTSYTFTSLSYNTTYYFKVYSYVTIDGTKYLSDSYQISSAIKTPPRSVTFGSITGSVYPDDTNGYVTLNLNYTNGTIGSKIVASVYTDSTLTTLYKTYEADCTSSSGTIVADKISGGRKYWFKLHSKDSSTGATGPTSSETIYKVIYPANPGRLYMKYSFDSRTYKTTLTIYHNGSYGSVKGYRVYYGGSEYNVRTYSKSNCSSSTSGTLSTSTTYYRDFETSQYALDVDLYSTTSSSVIYARIVAYIDIDGTEYESSYTTCSTSAPTASLFRTFKFTNFSYKYNSQYSAYGLYFTSPSLACKLILTDIYHLDGFKYYIPEISANTTYSTSSTGFLVSAWNTKYAASGQKLAIFPVYVSSSGYYIKGGEIEGSFTQ